MLKIKAGIVGLFTLIAGLTPDMTLAAMEDDPLLYNLMLDELEINLSDDEELRWDVQAWLGKDLKKIWFKTEGERRDGNTDEFEVQALYSRAIARYWDFQIGLRHDTKLTPEKNWGVIGVQGLAPYFFEVDAALFIGESGNAALRLNGEYDLLLTQQLILSPELEVNLYAQNIPDISKGSGLSDVNFSLRLRYEIRREFAPYIGVNWWKKYGNSADFARTDGMDADDTQFVIGLRAWF